MGRLSQFWKIMFLGLVPLLWVASLSGCGKSGGEGCTGALCVSKLPFLEPDPSTVNFDRGSIDVGAVAYKNVVIRNTGEGVLEITSVTMNVDSLSPAEEAEPAFFISENLPAGTKVAPLNQGDAFGLPEEVTIVLGYRRYEGDPRSATLYVEHGTSANPSNTDQQNPFPITVSEGGGDAALLAIPEEVVFQNVQKNTFNDKNVMLLNTGATELIVSQIQLQGDVSFSLLLDPDDDTSVVDAGVPAVLDPPIVIGAGQSHAFKVRFKPTDEAPQSATVIVASNDPSLAAGLSIPVRGNHSGPCVEWEPGTINFGAKLLSQPHALPLRLMSCGKDELLVTGVRLDDTGSTTYQLDSGSFLVDSNPGPWPSAESPRSIPVNGMGELEIIFTPEVEAVTDGEGNLIPDATNIIVSTNTFEGEVIIPVIGYGTLTPCPTAVITIVEGGSEIPPQTLLKLSGTDSLPSAGVVGQYSWSVQQPQGSQSILQPGANFPEINFEANVSGKYTFELEVQDAEAWSCVPATREILVIPDEAIHLELTWDTPGDANQEDTGFQAGADMDLHFVHMNNALSNPNGEDLYPPPHGDGIKEGYFDDIWDTFWFYSTQKWGNPVIPDDDPSLDRDDTDGAGPENLNINVPESGVTYKIGVHYWKDWGFGKSTPTVNIYLFGKNEATIQGCPMITRDMWEVGTIAWPSQQVDQWTCTGNIPQGTGEWPDKPCGTASNDPDDSTPENECQMVIMREYLPENFGVDW